MRNRADASMAGMGTLRSFAFCGKATSAVEFALLMPVFLLLVTGIFAYGTYFALTQSVQQLTAEAVRSSLSGGTDSERQAMARAYVDANIQRYALLAATGLVAADAATNVANGTLSVTLRYDASRMLIFNLPALIPMPPAVIVRTAVISRRPA